MNFELVFKMTIAFVVLGACFAAGIFFKRVGYKIFVKWAKKTKWHADDAFVPALRGHLFFWFILLGAYFASTILFRQTVLANIIKGLVTLFILSLTLLLSRTISSVIKIYSEQAKTTVGMSELIQGIARSIVLLVGFLMILNNLGISITPLLTTLGIGGLAVALALQDTLSNFFAGIHVVAAKQIRIGDFIKSDGGIEGYVADINWRTTKIRMLSDNMVFIPNLKLSQSVITNYCFPQKELNVAIELGVHCNSDLDEVEKATLEAAKEAMQDESGSQANFSPSVSFNGFGESSINLTVVLRAKEFIYQSRLKHKFIKLLHKKYKEKGIVIPYPIRAINITQEDTHKYLGKG
ncbi:MAG: mechanosensitive ion channel family protein [Candidatus Omnitrophota bacterium]